MTTEAAVQAAIVTTWMRDVAEAVKAESAHLTQLDAAIGDGDHGVNMSRGFTAVGKAVAGQGDSVPPGQLLVLTGKTLVSTVGGASGPLWGTAFRRAGSSSWRARRSCPPLVVRAVRYGVSRSGARAAAWVMSRASTASSSPTPFRRR